MSIQSSYLSPASQWLDLTGKVLILRQSSGSIAITTGTGFGWGPSADGYGLGRAQHGGIGTNYNEYILLDRAEYDLVYQSIYFDAGVTFFEDFLKTCEFIFYKDINDDGEIFDTAVDRAFHYAFHASSIQASSQLKIEFSQTPSDLQLVFEKLDQNGDRTGAIAPVIEAKWFVEGQLTQINTGLLTGSYDGINNVLSIGVNWDQFYGIDYKNVIGAGSVMVSIAAGSGSLSDGAVYATAMYGTDTSDEIYGSVSDERIVALKGNDYVESGLGDDVIDGGAGNDNLHGGEGADTLIGGSGLDSLSGGAADDVYVTEGGDMISEGSDAGIDIVQSSASFTLGENLENLTLTGSTAINGTGNSFNNTITGSTGANILDGGTGTDTLIGGAGNDTYVTDGDETITEAASAGTDTVRSSISYTLGLNLENLTLTGLVAINGAGNTLNNVINGNVAANTLNGGTGTDTLVGGLGDDIYVTDGGDTITEAASAGTDTVQSSLNYTLGTNLENLSLTGTSAINGTGNTLNNVITGNSGNNTLSGGTGTDTLIGGLGNDTYITDGGDTITEAASAGTDIVKSSASFTLGENLENLTLTGSTAIIGTGNSGNNTINGNTGNNILDGGSGADTLIGGTGNDTYVTDGGDTITEAASAGTDSVQSSVTFILGSNLENLTLTGSSAINATGNTLNNVINGNGAENLITAGTGKDTVTGGNGKDTFIFNAVTDSGTTATKADVITDFVSGEDKIDLSAIDAFVAAGANDTFVWKDTAVISSINQGEVRYQQFDNIGSTNDYTMIWIDNDADASVEMAIRLTGLFTLTAADFIL